MKMQLQNEKTLSCICCMGRICKQHEHGTSHLGHMVMWLVVLYWLSMSPATHMSKLIRSRFCRRPMRCIVQWRGAHRTETVNAERSKTRKHHRTDLITRLPSGWIYNRFFNNVRCSVSRLNTSCFRLFHVSWSGKRLSKEMTSLWLTRPKYLIYNTN